MASKADTKRRFRPRWSLGAALIVTALCELLCARIAHKKEKHALQRQEEQGVERHRRDLGGKKAYAITESGFELVQ